MRLIRPAVVVATALCVALPTAAYATSWGGSHHHRQPTLALSVLGTHAAGSFETSAAEITDYDPYTRQVFVVNAERGEVDVLDATNPSAPTARATIAVVGLAASDGSTIPAGSQVNSVAYSHGLVAVAVESATKTDPGWVVVLRSRGLSVLSTVRVGAQPDMVTFDDLGRTIVTADEGEPADDFSADPAGSVSIIDVPRALRGRDAVRTAGFGAWDRGRALPAGVRVFGPDAPDPNAAPGTSGAGRVARNLEPEYVTIEGHRAYVTLQENNALAVVDLNQARVSDIVAMPGKDWNRPGNVLDPSDRDAGIALASWPLKSLLMPDSIASYRAGGRTYLVTANEGDAREWGDYEDGARIKDLDLCADAFPNAATLQRNENLGRLAVTTESGQRGDGCFEELYAFGGRSFSILDDRGRLVFDSAGQIEQKIAELVAAGDLPEAAFNADNNDNDSFDSRSDAKGPEPEGLALGQIGLRTYAFIGLERTSGILVYDVTDPRRPTFTTFADNRDYSVDAESAQAGDLGPEGLHFVSAAQSPTRTPLLIVGNEVSGTTTIWKVDLGR